MSKRQPLRVVKKKIERKSELSKRQKRRYARLGDVCVQPNCGLGTPYVKRKLPLLTVVDLSNRARFGLIQRERALFITHIEWWFSN